MSTISCLLPETSHTSCTPRDDTDSSLESKPAPLQPIRNRPLPGGWALRERSTASKRTGGRPVPHADDTHIVHSRNRPLTRHTRRHLHCQREVLVRRETQTLEPHARYVLRHLGCLERRFVGATRRAVHGGIQRASAVLVDLK